MTTIRRSLILFAASFLLLIAPAGASALSQPDLDFTFGTNGVMSLSSDTGIYGAALEVQSDGKILVAYSTASGGPAVARRNGDGSPDQSFGTGGKVNLPNLGGSDCTVKRLLIGSDGTIYLFGSEYTGNDQAAVWAMKPSGAPETFFNGTGSKLLPIVGTSGNDATDADLTPDGNIAVASGADVGGDQVVSLRVISKIGAITVNVTKASAGIDIDPTSLLVQPSGRMVVGVAALTPLGVQAALFGLTAAGADDATFGPGGSTPFGPPVPIYSFPTRIFNLNGGIGAVGNSGYTSAFGSYSVDGAPSADLGPFGLTRILPSGTSLAYSFDGAAVANGKTASLNAGASTSSLPPFLIRLNANGTPDSSFAPGGFAFLSVGVWSNPTMAVQPDGKYLIAGTTGDNKVNIARVWGDYPAPQPAVTSFAPSLKSKQSVKKGRRFAGKSVGTGVTAVDVAIQKLDSKLLKKSKKCTYVKSTKAALKNVKAVAGKCVPTVWLRAKGTTSWSLKLSKPLKPGKYVISARATGFLGLGPAVTKSVTLTK